MLEDREGRGGEERVERKQEKTEEACAVKEEGPVRERRGGRRGGGKERE